MKQISRKSCICICMYVYTHTYIYSDEQTLNLQLDDKGVMGLKEQTAVRTESSTERWDISAAQMVNQIIMYVFGLQRVRHVMCV